MLDEALKRLNDRNALDEAEAEKEKVWQLQHHFWTISHAFLLAFTPYTPCGISTW